MKIDQDLRYAIRAAEKLQPVEKTRCDIDAAAIKAMLKRCPKHAQAIKQADRLTQQAKDLTIRAMAIYGSLGVSSSLQWINDADTFVKAGGKIEQPTKRWRADVVIAQLAMADEKSGKKLLRDLGIRWE